MLPKSHLLVISCSSHTGGTSGWDAGMTSPTYGYPGAQENANTGVPGCFSAGHEHPSGAAECLDGVGQGGAGIHPHGPGCYFDFSMFSKCIIGSSVPKRCSNTPKGQFLPQRNTCRVLLGQIWICSISSGCLILNPTKSCRAAVGRQCYLPLGAWKSSVEMGSAWLQARSKATTFTH